MLTDEFDNNVLGGPMFKNRNKHLIMFIYANAK